MVNIVMDVIVGLIALLIFGPVYFVWNIIKPVFNFIQKLIKPLFSRLSGKVMNSPRFGQMIRKLLSTDDKDILSHLAAEAKRLANDPQVSQGERLLINDRRREYAELIAPPTKCPTFTLYKHVPADLRRSIIADGRIVNGVAPAKALAGLALTPEFVKKAWTNAVSYGIKFAIITFLLCVTTTLATVYIVMPSMSKTTATDGESHQQEQVADMSFLAARYQDIWTQEQATELASKVNIVDNSAKHAAAVKAVTAMTVQSIVMLLMLLAASVGFAFWAGRTAFLMSLRFRVFDAADQAVDGLRHSWREAMQRWRWRLDEREMEQQSFNDQVHFATEIDRSPLLDIGKALGVMEFRGHSLAPLQHTQVQMSVADLLMHVAVLGGSGEGKSRDFYVPMVRQLLELRKQGYPISIYATDDKGAIGTDILDACRDIGIPDEDIIVIGTGPNDWRVDLLDGLTPIELTEIMASIAKQSGGESNDSFWPAAGSELILHISTVLYLYELTDAGRAWIAKNNMRAYSLLNILRVASNDEEIEEALRVVTDALQNKNNQYQFIADLDNNALHTSIDYLAFTWLTMVDATSLGVRLNMRTALRGFAFKDVVASGFADGVGVRLLSAKDINSNKVTIINVSQIEHGMAGRMVSIILKTLLFKQARDAEQQDPAFAKERLQWWFNPSPGPENDKYAITVFLADEYQSLITSSTDGLSDGLVWNVLRSAGIAGVLLSQSWAAYRLTVGDKAIENIRNNWRTKIFLRTEDVGTIDEAKRLAGKVMRFQSMDWNHYEGTVAVRREKGIDIESNTVKTTWDNSVDGLFSNSRAVSTVGSWMKGFGFSGYNNIYEQDHRFILKFWQRGGIGQDQHNNADAVTGSKQASAWRQEDRSSSILQHGSSEVEAVRDQELMEMGRGRALCFIQRAGGTRVDFVKLNSK